MPDDKMRSSREPEIEGPTYRVYIFLCTQGNNSAGVREVQRALGLSGPSSALLQLEKLRERGLARKDLEGRYCLIQPEKIIIHFIASDNLESPENSFIEKRMTPWHIHHLSVNISRREAYEKQCDRVRQRGVKLIEVRTNAPPVGPNTLKNGPLAYDKAREATLKILSKED